MGALHAGHLSLINGRDKKMQQSLLVSLLILCNLDQRRLSTLDQDRQLCEQAGVDFAPTAGVGKGRGRSDSLLSTPLPVLRLSPFAMTSVLCGRSDLDTFRVATIVTSY